MPSAWNCKPPQFHLYFRRMMTILTAQWSLRSHDSLTNFNMSTQLSNTWPQQKTTNVMWSSLWPWDERGVNVNMGAAQHCQSWRAEPPPPQMFTRHSDAQCCNITLITRVRRENGRQYAQRPDRARGLGQRGHHQQTQSLLTESYKKTKQKGNNVQHRMAQQSGFGLIWQFTGGEKRSGKQENDLVALMRGFFSGAAWIHTYNRSSNKATFRHHNTQKTGTRNVLKRKRKAFCRLNKYLQPRGRSLCRVQWCLLLWKRARQYNYSVQERVFLKAQPFLLNFRHLQFKSQSCFCTLWLDSGSLLQNSITGRKKAGAVCLCSRWKGCCESCGGLPLERVEGFIKSPLRQIQAAVCNLCL